MSPFDPALKLAQLCRRHGLPDGAGARFLPMLERAANARPDQRDRLLGFVGRQLKLMAEERAAERQRAAIRNEACLRALAPLLHTWSPEKAG